MQALVLVVVVGAGAQAERTDERQASVAHRRRNPLGWDGIKREQSISGFVHDRFLEAKVYSLKAVNQGLLK